MNQLRRVHIVAPALAVAFAIACASTPRPRVLSEADTVSQSPAAKEAAELSPQAYAAAENLRKKADAAESQGDFSGAQILGEHSLAAYEHAFALTRYVKAEQRLGEAEKALAKVKQDLTGLDEQQSRISAEADALEMRIKVVLDKQPLGKMPEASSAERQAARRESARALASEARLLCAATEMLSPQQPGVEKARADLEKLDADLKQASTKDDIFPRAVAARTACLSELTLARRPATAAAPEAGITDRLLVELTETQKLFAFRDDRGVVVSLRGIVDDKGTPTKDAGELLALLGRTAKAHPNFPLLVVVHTAGPAKASPDKVAQAQGDSVANALKNAGAPSVRTFVAGSAQPVADSHVPGAAERNARIEVVFVSPAR